VVPQMQTTVPWPASPWTVTGQTQLVVITGASNSNLVAQMTADPWLLEPRQTIPWHRHRLEPMLPLDLLTIKRDKQATRAYLPTRAQQFRLTLEATNRLHRAMQAQIKPVRRPTKAKPRPMQAPRPSTRRLR
jgi:hypothetical protein